jgi:carbamoyl-phosphate synthase small subunit
MTLQSQSSTSEVDESANTQDRVLQEIKMRTASSLILKDGTIFKGYSFGAQRPTNGETVFSTSMVGYPEALTDPSYRGQILCLTYPLIGNYGVPRYETTLDGLPVFFESDRIHVRGLVVHRVCETPSHYQSVRSLDEWLRQENIPGIYGVDTRRLTRILRERGVMLSTIITEDAGGESRMDIDDPNKYDLVREVSVRRPITYGEGRKHRIALIDCGVKYGIIRNLLKRNFAVVRMPYDVKTSDVIEVEPAGVVVSNGPGDPKTCKRTINTIRELIESDMPVLGICLGNQLIALAEGADTYKMKYGHRSQNQPVVNVESGRCYITTQNHGYAVDRTQLENTGLDVWFVNANDRSIEGIRHSKKPCWGVQWHPEATPGPTDTEFIFDFYRKKVIHHAAA